MSDKEKDSPGETPHKRRRARRPATIDLAATEVKEEAAEGKGAPGKAEKDKEAASEGQKAGQKPAASETPQNGKPEEKKPEPAKPDAPAGAGKTSDSAKTDDKAAVERPAPKRRAAWPLFAGGAVAGGVIALGLYAGLAQMGLAPGLGGNVAQLDVRVGALETRLANLQAAIPERGEMAPAADVSELARRIDALEARSGDDQAGGLQPIREDLSSLAARLAVAEEEARAARGEVDALTARLAASGENTQSAAAAGAALSQRITSAEQVAARAAEAAAAAARAGETAREAVRAQMAQEIDDRASSLAKRMDELESGVAALGEKVAAGDSAPRLQAQAALAIAVAGLERAVDSGAPFTRELGVVEGLAGKDGAEIATLREVAGKGVARPGELAESFPPVATAILAAGAGAGKQDLMSRLMDNARSLVRVRPTGDVAGNSRAAIVARMEERLSAGDIEGALAETEALDAPARAAAADWLARAQEAMKARSQVQGLAARVAAGLAKSDGVAPK